VNSILIANGSFKIAPVVTSTEPKEPGGAGIGAGGADSHSYSRVGDIIIQGGLFDVQGDVSAAGLGAGEGKGDGKSSVQTIAIQGGSGSFAGGSSAPGIGAGSGGADKSSVASLSLAGGNVTAKATIPIGGSKRSRLAEGRPVLHSRAIRRVLRFVSRRPRLHSARVRSGFGPQPRRCLTKEAALPLPVGMI
jgi:hypothetical protein